MDKLCTKLLVFEGEGKVKEWVGSYTELREVQKRRLTAAKSAAPSKEPVKAAPVEEVKKATGAKLTFNERKELNRIDTEMPKLEKKKEELLAVLAKGGTDHHAMMERSMELEETIKQLDRMTDRWLELSERA